MKILIVTTIKITVFLFLESYPVFSFALNTDDNSIHEMCSVSKELFDIATHPSRPNGEYKLSGKMKELSDRLNYLMDGKYYAPSRAISTYEELEEYYAKNGDVLLITFNKYDANNKILFGHTLNNNHVIRELKKYNVLYVDISTNKNTNIEDKFKMQSHLKVFTLGIIFTSINDGIRTQEIGFRDTCIQPSALLKWLQNINSSNNAFEHDGAKRRATSQLSRYV